MAINKLIYKIKKNKNKFSIRMTFKMKSYKT